MAVALLTAVVGGFPPARRGLDNAFAKEDVITLRVCNWEEYIDLGGWDEEERIELDNGVEILGENALYKEFEDWYYETYGKRVQVEYSCFGTNEDLYNQLTLGDTYDLVCPSDYMIMKLMAEGALEPYSEAFFDQENEENYYRRCVSPYIAQVFAENQIGGESWERYAAGYMWGVTGVLYNPERMTQEEASTWAVFDNPDFYRQITLKDNVRDTYFSTLGYLLQDQLTEEAFIEDPDYHQKLAELMNDVSPETIDAVEEQLAGIMKNIYALETDSGKADMVTGKIIANYQWSGDCLFYKATSPRD
ncbi:MAG: extracellular solute-binding protein, partial [Acetatifactor sp.]|nr:extracellular solute-binding protein [Acetatifactor sp.]